MRLWWVEFTFRVIVWVIVRVDVWVIECFWVWVWVDFGVVTGRGGFDVIRRQDCLIDAFCLILLIFIPLK